MSPRLLIRLTALALVLIALFDPIWTRATRKVQVLFAVDISHSVEPDSLAQSLAWLASAEGRDSRTRYLAFADQARVVDDLDQLRALPVTDEPGSGPEGALARDRTDLGAALDAATVELGGEAIRRLVLLSDGRTDGGVRALDSGAWSTGGWSSGGNEPGADSKGSASSTAVDRGLLQSVAELVRAGIRVDVVPLESSLRKPAISSISLAGEPRAKAPLPVAVQVISPSARGARIRIVSSGAGGDRTLYERDVDLVAGRQVVRALVRLPDPGRAELTALLDGEVQWRQQVAIGESPRVLLVAGAPGGPLRAALSAQGWQVRQVSPETMTTSRQELAGYDATVLSNVAAGRLGTARMELISDWVIEDGGGLLFASGDATFGEEGYSDSPLEAILPLRFNVEEERTDVALMVALDKSYSMKGPKIELAKEATKAALGELDERHRFGVVAFDWEPYEVVPLDSVRNRERMLESISRIEA